MADSLGDIIVRFIADAQPLLDGITSSVTSLGGFSEAVTDVATGLGVATTAYELLKDSLEDYASIQKAQIAFANLLGSVDDAETAITNLQQMATGEGLDFPALLTADQRMLAFGFSTDQANTSLQAIADTASGTGTDIDKVTGAFDRAIESGTLTGRTLVALGINATDLGNVMGVTADQAAAMFKALDQSDKIDVLNTALGKFSGQSQAAADSLIGKWTTAKDSFGKLMEDIGGELAPVASAMLTFLTNVATAADHIGDIAKIVGTMLSGGLGPPSPLASTPEAPTPPPASGVGSTTDTGDSLAGSGLSATAKAAIDAQLLSDALKDAQTNLALVKTAMDDGAATADDLAAAQDKVTAAFIAVNPQFQDGAFFAQSADIQFGNLFKTTNDFGDTLVDVGPPLQTMVTQFNGFTTVLPVTEQQFKDNQDALDQLTQQVIDAGKPMADLLAAHQNIIDVTPPLVDAFSDTSTAAKAFYTEEGANLTTSLKGIKSSIDDATLSGGQFHDAVVLNIPDVSELKTKLDDATTSYDNLQTSGANNYQLMEGKRQVLLDQITYTQQLGGNTSDLKIQLDHLDASLQSEPTLWSTVQTAMKGVGDELKTGVGTAIDSVIAGTSSLGDAFKKMGLDVVDIIVNSIIKLGIQKLFDAIASIGAPGGPISSIGVALGGVATQASSLVTSIGSLGSGAADIGAAGTGAIGDTVSTGDTLAGIGSTAASTGGDAASGLGGLLSAGGGLVSSLAGGLVAAIPGLLSLFGVGNSGDQLDRLNHISDATQRLAQIYDVQMIPWIGDLVTKADYFSQYQFDGWFHDFCFGAGDDLDGIHQNSDTINATLIDIKTSLTAMATPGAASAAAPLVVNVNLQGAVVGVADLADQISSAIANALKLQGVPA